jgi:hypothetical protein
MNPFWSWLSEDDERDPREFRGTSAYLRKGWRPLSRRPNWQVRSRRRADVECRRINGGLKKTPKAALNANFVRILPLNRKISSSQVAGTLIPAALGQYPLAGGVPRFSSSVFSSGWRRRHQHLRRAAGRSLQHRIRADDAAGQSGTAPIAAELGAANYIRAETQPCHFGCNPEPHPHVLATIRR